MADNRIPRESRTREKTARTTSWRPPELLPTPDPQNGYVFRWVRVSTNGASDPTNINSKLRQGWEPVKASDHKELAIFGSEDDRFPENVVVGGLILCKAPAELVKERSEYYRQQTNQQMESVDNGYMRENDPRMPVFKDRKSSVTFGNGT